MSVKRRDIIRYLEKNGFFLDGRAVAVKRHNIFDRISANETCKDAELKPIF